MYSKSERKISMFLLLDFPVKSKHFWLANMNGAMMKFKSSFRDVLSFAPPALFSSKFSLQLNFSHKNIFDFEHAL